MEMLRDLKFLHRKGILYLDEKSHEKVSVYMDTEKVLKAAGMEAKTDKKEV